MKIAITLAAFIATSVFGAPTEDLLRTKISAYSGAQGYGGAQAYGGASSYGAASYGPPCSGAPLAPIALYLAPQSAPHYREEDSNGEHSEHSRSYEASSYGASSSIVAPASGGAVGYFPNAKIGGCAVPLLLSCAPNVVAGHLAKAHAYPAIPSYRQNENQETTELRETMEKSWSDDERASHVGHHHHLVSLNENHEVMADHTHNAPV